MSYAGHKYIREGRSHGRGRLAQLACALLLPLLIFSSCGASRGNVPRSAAATVHAAAAIEFETWVLIQNPSGNPVHVDLKLQTDTGEVTPPELSGVEIAPRSRRTFRLNDYVSTYHVSTLVHARDGQVVAERAVYGGDRAWGTDSIGATAPAPDWYLAEGSTEGGMETWVLIQNPSGNPVHVDLKLQTDTGEVTPPELSGVEIAPRSRRTFRLNDYVSTYHVSTLVHARDGQVVAERAVYGGDRAWGTDSIGATAPAPDWYLAEGSTEGGMETWVLIQNPSGNPVHVDLKLQTDTGEVTPPELSGVEIAPRSRRTFRLNDYVSTYHVSTLVHARDGQVVAERAVYGGDRAWGTDSIGATAPAPDWYLAEGSTEGGMETWVLIQNPSGNPVHVDLKLQTDTGEVTPPELSGVEIAPRSRRTFRLNDYVSTYHVSTLVHARDGQVVAERAVYGGDRAWGTDSIGATAPAPDWYLAEGAAYPGAGQGMVPLTVTERSGVARDGELVTCGVPLPRDAAVYPVSELAVVSGSGAAVPLQAEITARWGGAPNDATSPAQWVLLTFPATVGAGGSAFYYLRKGGGGAAHSSPVTLADDGTILTVNTGAARFELGRDSFDLLHSVEINGAGTVVTPRDTNGFSLFAGGREYRSALAAPASFKVLESGPLRAVVEVEGTHAGSGGAFMHYTARLHFYAGASWVRVQYTLSNRNAPRAGRVRPTPLQGHRLARLRRLPGGWRCLRPATGASTGIYLAAGEGASPLIQAARPSPSTRIPPAPTTGIITAATTPAPRPTSPSAAGRRGARVRPQVAATRRSRGWRPGSNGVGMAVGMKDFWRNCPKGLGWSDGEARLSLFPQEYAGDFSFRAGEEKTHEIFLDFFAGDPGGAGVGERMAALEDPLFGLAPPEWYAGSGAFGRMALTGGGADTAAYEDQNRAAFDPSIGGVGNSLAMSILANDFYGWCDYGDVPWTTKPPAGR